MDSVLELDTREVQHIKESLAAHKELFKTNAQALFEDCFLLLTSTQAKTENFQIMSQLGSEQSQDLEAVFNIVLNLCAQVFRLNVRGPEEFQLVLDDLGLKGSSSQGPQQAFAKCYIARVEQLNTILEDEEAAMTAKPDKKYPLNMSMTDDMLCVSNPRIVDIEWQTVYSLASKNLNKLMQPVFKITLTLLCQGDFQRGGVVETVAQSSKRNQLTIKKQTFECDYQELQQFSFKVKHACNSLEKLVMPKKE